MAFETAQTKIRAVGRAGNVLGLLRTIYAHMDELQAMLATYQAGTDEDLSTPAETVGSTAARSMTISAAASSAAKPGSVTARKTREEGPARD